MIRCLEEEIFESPIDMISLIYVLFSYAENLKKDFTEFLDKCNILI